MAIPAWTKRAGMPTTLPLLTDDIAGCCSPLTAGVLDDAAAERLARVFKALGRSPQQFHSPCARGSTSP